MRHRLTYAERQRGGQKTAAKPGGRCPRSNCRKYYDSHLKLAGHLGLHSFADRYTDGDMREAARRFNLLGIAATDPIPWNGAFVEARHIAEQIAEQIAERARYEALEAAHGRR